jgi:hypothetical protein
VQSVLGAKRCGIVSLTFTAGTLAKQELIEPDGLEQHTVTVDLPDPYHKLTAFFTSAPILASSAAVNSVRAK